MSYLKLIICIFIIALTSNCSPSKYIDLTETNVQLTNRTYSDMHDSSTGVISISPKEGGGMAIIKSIQFETGTIEFDVKGENNPGKSFVGIAFNIQDEDTYESIYFRPFNFLAKEQIRRSHSIQYMYEPAYPWRRLRDEHENVFEAEYFNPPNPDDWFSVKVEISLTHVTVFDSKSNKTLLKIMRLGDQKSDKIGFWTGHNSKGDFRNLRVNRD